jgi:hypothetical protein
MTYFVKREFEELEKFHQRVSQYGLEANRRHLGGRYEGLGTDVFILDMTTERYPVKGNKKLIERLVQDGFEHRVYQGPDRKMYFYVYGSARIVTKELEIR